MDDTPEHNDDAPKGGGRCPICRRASSATARPFCSPRCREVDLGRWLSGSYAIAGGTTDEDGEDLGLGDAARQTENDDDDQDR